MALRTCYIVLTKQEGFFYSSGGSGFLSVNFEETLEFSEKLSSSFKKYVYYGTSFNMYQWHIAF